MVSLGEALQGMWQEGVKKEGQKAAKEEGQKASSRNLKPEDLCNKHTITSAGKDARKSWQGCGGTGSTAGQDGN